MLNLTITGHEYRSLYSKHVAAQHALAQFEAAFAAACHARNFGDATFVSLSPETLVVSLPTVPPEDVVEPTPLIAEDAAA
jgi:hypothetical protein